MPLYEYVCQDCQSEQELLLRVGESPECERCGSSSMQKLLSVPSAPAAKGSTGGPSEGSCGTGCGCF